MNKKLTYAIPVLGLAMTGCGDPIVGDWNIDSIDGDPMPYTYTYTYEAYGLTVSCDASITPSALTINSDLEASLTITASYECSGYYSYSDSTTYSYSGAVTVNKKKTSYGIILTGDDATISMDCAMSDKVNLNCSNSDGDTMKLSKIE